MSQHDFDKELQSLYQKRKQQITPPDVVTPSIAKKKWALYKPSLFMIGSLTAFGLLAVVNHFYAAKPKRVSTPPASKLALEIIPYEEAEVDVIKVAEPLPPLPETQLPTSVGIKSIALNHKIIDVEVSLSVDPQKGITIPDIHKAAVPVLPSIKVMPAYDIYDLNGKKSANIELRYQVNLSGHPHNIEVISSSANRKLQKSAIKALSQWHYPLAENLDTQKKYYRVMFDFITEGE